MTANELRRRSVVRETVRAVCLLARCRWKNPIADLWILEGPTWQVSVFRSNRVLPEDVTEEIPSLLPGIQFLTELHLEGKATSAALRLVRSTLAFLNEHAYELVVWYPHRPVTSVHLVLAKSVGATKLGFRTNLLQIAVEAAALSQPGWRENLQLFWRQASNVVTPIYGEVRTLGDRVRRGSTIFIKPGSKGNSGVDNSQLTKTWWWRGIPKQLGSAAVLESKYQKLWPAFLSNASLEEGLAFASVD